MSTNNVGAPPSSSPATSASSSPTPRSEPKQQGSNVRLIVLLGLLAAVIGAYAYDYLVAKPAAEAAEVKIQEFVDSRNKMGVRDAEAVTPQEISKLLNMKPTIVEKHPDENYEIEYYCWWGAVPLLNTRRQFISVVYCGVEEPRRFSSHHRNEKPPEEALPIQQQPTVEESAIVSEPNSPGGKAASADGSGEKAAEAPSGEEGKGITEPPPAKDAAPSAEAPAPKDP